MNAGNELREMIEKWIEEEDSPQPPKGRFIRDKHRNIHFDTAKAISVLEKEVDQIKGVIDSILSEKAPKRNEKKGKK